MLARINRPCRRSVMVALLLSAGSASADITIGTPHTDQQSLPIALGTSGDYVGNTCAAGTLGLALKDHETGKAYILTNSHVLPPASVGKAVQHVAPLDQYSNCADPRKRKEIAVPFAVAIVTESRVTAKTDAAIAEIGKDERGDLMVSTLLLDIPEYDPHLRPPVLDTYVKKSGRTTGLTYGIITGVDVEIKSGGRLFRDQIKIDDVPAINKRVRLTANGDSGSAWLECVDDEWHPTGLHFLGNPKGTTAWANVLTAVTSAFKGKDLRVLEAPPPDPDQDAANCNDELKARLGGVVPDAAAAMPILTDDQMAVAAETLRRHDAALLAVPGVLGAGVAHWSVDPGHAAIRLYTTGIPSSLAARVPKVLEGIPIDIEQAQAVPD